MSREPNKKAEHTSPTMRARRKTMAWEARRRRSLGPACRRQENKKWPCDLRYMDMFMWLWRYQELKMKIARYRAKWCLDAYTTLKTWQQRHHDRTYSVSDSHFLLEIEISTWTSLWHILHVLKLTSFLLEGLSPATADESPCQSVRIDLDEI